MVERGQCQRRLVEYDARIFHQAEFYDLFVHAVRGRDISSVARTSEGRYQVIFNTNVRSCGYFATIGDASASAPPQNSQISVSSLGTNVNGVAVRTENGANGNELDRSFHLIVMC